MPEDISQSFSLTWKGYNACDAGVGDAAAVIFSFASFSVFDRVWHINLISKTYFWHMKRINCYITFGHNLYYNNLSKMRWHIKVWLTDSIQTIPHQPTNRFVKNIIRYLSYLVTISILYLVNKVCGYLRGAVFF